jgi:hypothetical protein
VNVAKTSKTVTINGMEQISFEQCFKGAWQDMWRSLVNRADCVLLLIAYFLSCLIRVQMRLDEVAVGPVGTPSLWHATVSLVCSLIQFATWVGLPVQAMRYVLVGPVNARASSFFDRGFWRYCLICLLVGVMTAVGAGFVYAVAHGLDYRFEQPYALLAAAALLAACLMTYFSTRLCLLLAHVAAGGSLRWRAAWHDSQGRFWSLWRTHFVVALPLSVATTVCFRFLAHILTDSAGNARAWFFGVVPPLAFTGLLLLSVSCSAWQYRRYATTLRGTLSRADPRRL